MCGANANFDCRLDYLVNVYGLAVEEAATYLAANP